MIPFLAWFASPIARWALAGVVILALVCGLQWQHARAVTAERKLATVQQDLVNRSARDAIDRAIGRVPDAAVADELRREWSRP